MTIEHSNIAPCLEAGPSLIGPMINNPTLLGRIAMPAAPSYIQPRWLSVGGAVASEISPEEVRPAFEAHMPTFPHAESTDPIVRHSRQTDAANAARQREANQGRKAAAEVARRKAEKASETNQNQ